MSLAEQMLATMSESDDFVSYLADKEGHIVINESRQAIVPAELKTIAVTGDKDIETVTFDCVRYWDGHDLSTFAIYLNYVLPDRTEGTYIPKAITTSDGEDVFHFDWEIKNNITEKSGKISFAVTAVKTKQNENGETVVDKQWSSLPNGDCSIALGLGISNVPAEEESSDVVAQLSAILEKIHGDLDEWIKTVVVQTTGTSKTQVMSQEAVTTSLNIYKVESIQQSNEYTDSKSNLIDKKILQNSNKISRNSKRITNLEQGLTPDPFDTDDSVAYQKDVPANALPYAEVNKIGGMSRKCPNLIPYPYPQSTITVGGITFTDNKDGSITINGTSTDTVYYNLTTGKLSNIGQCTISAGASTNLGIWFTVYDDSDNPRLTLQTTYDFTGKSFGLGICVVAGKTINNVTIYPMLNEGTTALPYEPYYAGLRDTKVTEVKSVGANLMALPYSLSSTNVNGVTVAANSDGTISASGTSTALGTAVIADYTLPAGTYTIAHGGSNVGLQVWAMKGSSYGNELIVTFFNGNKSFTLPQTTTIRIRVYVRANKTVNETIKIMLNKGSTALPYEPYVEHTLPIPAEVQALDGYGLGVNENCYNYIEWQPEDNIKTWNNRVGVVDMGTLDWHIEGYYAYSQSLASKAKSSAQCDSSALPAGVTEISIADSKALAAYFTEGAYTDAATFKAAMSGVMLVYELAEPIITDISNLITADNLIGVEGGGTMTFENEYGYAVPSEVEYQVEV